MDSQKVDPWKLQAMQEYKNLYEKKSQKWTKNELLFMLHVELVGMLYRQNKKNNG